MPAAGISTSVTTSSGCACPWGRFWSGGATPTCTACGTNANTTALGATASTQCYCPIGYYGNPTSTCTLCGPNGYEGTTAAISTTTTTVGSCTCSRNFYVSSRWQAPTHAAGRQPRSMLCSGAAPAALPLPPPGPPRTVQQAALDAEAAGCCRIAGRRICVRGLPRQRRHSQHGGELSGGLRLPGQLLWQRQDSWLLALPVWLHRLQRNVRPGAVCTARQQQLSPVLAPDLEAAWQLAG
jgi:hypothetical protein